MAPWVQLLPMAVVGFVFWRLKQRANASGGSSKRTPLSPLRRLLSIGIILFGYSMIMVSEYHRYQILKNGLPATAQIVSAGYDYSGRHTSTRLYLKFNTSTGQLCQTNILVSGYPSDWTAPSTPIRYWPDSPSKIVLDGPRALSSSIHTMILFGCLSVAFIVYFLFKA